MQTICINMSGWMSRLLVCYVCFEGCYCHPSMQSQSEVLVNLVIYSVLKSELVDVLNISADIVQNILSLKYRLVSILLWLQV